MLSLSLHSLALSHSHLSRFALSISFPFLPRLPLIVERFIRGDLLCKRDGTSVRSLSRVGLRSDWRYTVIVGAKNVVPTLQTLLGTIESNTRTRSRFSRPQVGR